MQQEKKMQENAKQNAIDNGIYDLAYANAKKVITILYILLRNIKIVILK